MLNKLTLPEVDESLRLREPPPTRPSPLVEVKSMSPAPLSCAISTSTLPLVDLPLTVPLISPTWTSPLVELALTAPVTPLTVTLPLVDLARRSPLTPVTSTSPLTLEIASNLYAPRGTL